MSKVIVCWKNQGTGETGHGDPVDESLAEEYLDRNASSFPVLEFAIRPVQPGDVNSLAACEAAR